LYRDRFSSAPGTFTNLLRVKTPAPTMILMQRSGTLENCDGKTAPLHDGTRIGTFREKVAR
jgi:hypothetical protein